MTAKRLLAMLAILGVTASCGGGGGAAPNLDNNTVQILTAALQHGNVGHNYVQQLQATGGTPPYTWWISSSGEAVQQGLALSPDGLLAGSPGEAAMRSVVIVVQDADSSLDLQSYALEVRDVEISGGASGLLVPGTKLQFQATGGVANYAFSLSANQSGAVLTGSGSYTAGSQSGVDVVRATDSDGFFEEVAVTVGDDPFVGFQARWGTTDVWWIDFDTLYDPSPTYATDLDEVLVALGLRRTESTAAVGTEADDLARLLVLRRTLGWLSSYYGNGLDGNPSPGGLSISFVGPAGPGTGTLPPVGGVLGAAPDRYSSICVRHGPNAGVVGTAWLDGSNSNVEHDCGDPSSTALGVFPNRMLAPYLSSFNNSIMNDPVGPADVDGLRSLLFGSPPAGAREQAIFDVADGFGRVLGAVLAHEIGHSLGLQHSSPSTGPGDLMNTSLSVGPSINYAFNSGHWNQLLTNLPGPNR